MVSTRRPSGLLQICAPRRAATIFKLLYILHTAHDQQGRAKAALSVHCNSGPSTSSRPGSRSSGYF